MQFPSTVANAPASQLAILEKLAGPNVTFAEKQVGGLRALIEAGRLLRHGRADAVIAAAVDEAHWLNAEGYERLGALRRADREGLDARGGRGGTGGRGRAPRRAVRSPRGSGSARARQPPTRTRPSPAR